MLEKEIKILDIDIEVVQKQLLDFGAEKTFEGFIHDVYYDFPGDTMEDNKRLFRVRQKWETHLYTIKRKRVTAKEWWEKGVKIADEWERDITDVESFRKVLEKYGMKKTREKKKHRVSYRLDNQEFDIDQYDGIPTLLEIEAHSSEEIQESIKKLWLEGHVAKTFGSRWLYKHYWLDYSYL